MLPVLAVTGYAMRGLKSELLPVFSAKDWQRNDGIVNTFSQRGPDLRVVREVLRGLEQGLGEESEDGSVGLSGVYWLLGINRTIDHADEIGIFTAGKTVCSLFIVRFYGRS